MELYEKEVIEVVKVFEAGRGSRGYINFVGYLCCAFLLQNFKLD